MMPPDTPEAAAPWPWPSLRWERDEVLREQVALLRQNFPMTLLASLATALGTMWVMDGVADAQAMTAWLITHVLVVMAIYRSLRSMDPYAAPARQSAY